MNLNFNILGRRSGGAAALSAPSFLQVNGWSESRVDALVMEKFGQDYNQFEISDDSGFSNIIEATGDITNNYYSFTGLDEETTYYVRGRAKFGSVYTDWIEQSCYTLSTPLHAYDFRGIGYDTTNEYGKTGSPNTATQVSEVYSYRGTANTLTPNGAIGNIGANRPALGYSNNVSSAFTAFGNTQYYKPASPIDLGALPFTILWEVQNNHLSNSIFKTFMTNSADSNTKFEIYRSGIRSRFVVGTGGNYSQLFPTPLDEDALVRIIIKRTISGANATVTIGTMSVDDDSISWAAGVTNADLKNNAVFDRLFANESLNASSILNFYTKELSEEQIKREFKRAEQPSYTFKANDTSLMPTGVTWGDLDANDYYVDDLVYGATGGSSWVGVHTLGNQSAVRLALKDALITDFIKIYNHSNGKASSNVVLKTIPNQVYEPHNIGSLFPCGNTWVHLEMDNHSGIGLPTNILITRFGDNFNMTEGTLMPSGNWIPSYRGSNLQYLQGVKTPNSVIVLGQEFHGAGYAAWLTVLIFKDNFNYCKKVRVIEVPSSAYWFYPRLVYREDGTISILAQYLSTAVPQRYINSFLILSDDDFLTVRNIGNTWTKTMYGTHPVSATEATTNCLVGTDGTAKSYSRLVTSMFYDPDTSKHYGVETNGDKTGLNFLIEDGAGGWTITAIDVLGEPIEFGYTIVDDVGHGQNSPMMVRTGASSYDLYALSLVSGTYPNKIYKVVRLRTSDSWANTDSVTDMTDDDSNLHDRLAISHNLHYTGGSTAYNGKRLLVCSREFTTPSSKSDVKFMDIS